MDTFHHNQLLKFLSKVLSGQGVAEHVYVVGGAVRNSVLGQPIKDVDIVVDTIGCGKDSLWVAEAIRKAVGAKSNVTTNQYGVTILTIYGSSAGVSQDLDFMSNSGQGQVSHTIEIANARKESYGGAEGKGYKPHMVEPATIAEDLLRREFTFNTLLWRFSDLGEGFEKAPILDLLGNGLQHLKDRVLWTPSLPEKTFRDDPTRMLRAVKFMAKYGFQIPEGIADCIRANAAKLADMPWDAVRKILVEDILEAPNPVKSLQLLTRLGLSDVLKDMMESNPGFASAVGRSIRVDMGAELIWSIARNTGWPVRTPLQSMTPSELDALWLVLAGEKDPEAFFQTFLRPKLDQDRLFKSYPIPVKERGNLMKWAREKLLANPQLSECAQDLETAVERDVILSYGSMTLAGYSLSKCAKPCGKCKKASP